MSRMSPRVPQVLALVALAALAAPLAYASPAGLDTHVVSSEKPGGFGYLVTEIVADVAGTLTLVNVDLRAHDVVAFAAGPGDNPWCGRYAPSACPIFASPLIGLGQQAAVEGTEQLTPLERYTFYCSIHPWMTGTLTAI